MTVAIFTDKYGDRKTLKVSEPLPKTIQWPRPNFKFISGRVDENATYGLQLVVDEYNLLEVRDEIAYYVQRVQKNQGA